MRFNKKLHIPVLLALLAILAFVHTIFFELEEKVFITDSIFITPRSQPVLYVILVFAGVGLLLLGLYLGLVIVLYLFKKGIVYQTVGVFLLIMTGVFAYLLISGQTAEKTSDYFVGGFLILFTGTFGVLMTLADKIGKRRKK